MAIAKVRRKPAEDADAAERTAAYMLEDQVGFLLRCAHQRATEIFNAVMGRFAVTPTQFAALAKLDDLGSVSQNQLGRLTRMDPATVSGVVGRLIARGCAPVAGCATPTCAAGAHRRSRGGVGDEGSRRRVSRHTLEPPSPGGGAPAAGAGKSGEPHAAPAVGGSRRRAPAPVARADRRGAEGLRPDAVRAAAAACGRFRQSCRSCATIAMPHAHDEPARGRARGAADARGLVLRRRIRGAHGGWPAVADELLAT